MNDEKPPRLNLALKVLHGHGDIFADEWYRLATECGVVDEACTATRLIMWPDEDENRPTPAQDRFSAIYDEIHERTFAAAKQAISDAFVRVATEVLDRERERQR